MDRPRIRPLLLFRDVDDVKNMNLNFHYYYYYFLTFWGNGSKLH